MLTRRRLYWSAALLLTSGVLLAAAQSAALPADLDPQSRARLPYLQRKDLDENAQKIFDVLPGRSKDGVLSGPLVRSSYRAGRLYRQAMDARTGAIA